MYSTDAPSAPSSPFSPVIRIGSDHVPYFSVAVQYVYVIHVHISLAISGLDTSLVHPPIVPSEPVVGFAGAVCEFWYLNSYLPPSFTATRPRLYAIKSEAITGSLASATPFCIITRRTSHCIICLSNVIMSRIFESCNVSIPFVLEVALYVQVLIILSNLSIIINLYPAGTAFNTDVPVSSVLNMSTSNVAGLAYILPCLSS